jgi:hypothetical protein
LDPWVTEFGHQAFVRSVKPRSVEADCLPSCRRGLNFVGEAPLDVTALVIGEICFQQFLVAHNVRLVRPP